MRQKPPTTRNTLLIRLTAISSLVKTTLARTVGAPYDTITQQAVQTCNGSNPVTFAAGHCPNFINCMFDTLPPATTAGFQSGGNIAALVPTILALIGSPPLELVQLAFISPHRAIATCLFSIGLPTTLFRQLRPKLPELADRDGNEDLRRREWVIPLATFHQESSFKRFVGRLLADMIVVGLGGVMLWRNKVVGNETMVTWRCEYTWLLFFWPFACVMWLLIALVLLYALTKEISITYHDGIKGSTPKKLNILDLLALPYFKPKHAAKDGILYSGKSQEADIEEKAEDGRKESESSNENNHNSNDNNNIISNNKRIRDDDIITEKQRIHPHRKTQSMPLMQNMAASSQPSTDRTFYSTKTRQLRPLVSKFNDVNARYRTSAAPVSAPPLQERTRSQYPRSDDEEVVEEQEMQEQEGEEAEVEEPVSPIQRTQIHSPDDGEIGKTRRQNRQSQQKQPQYATYPRGSQQFPQYGYQPYSPAISRPHYLSQQLNKNEFTIEVPPIAVTESEPDFDKLPAHARVQAQAQASASKAKPRAPIIEAVEATKFEAKLQAKRLSIRRRRKAAIAAEHEREREREREREQQQEIKPRDSDDSHQSQSKPQHHGLHLPQALNPLAHRKHSKPLKPRKTKTTTNRTTTSLSLARAATQQTQNKILPLTPSESLDPSYRVTIFMRSPSHTPTNPTSNLSYEHDGFFRSIASWQWYEAIIETLAVGIYLYATFVLTSILFLSGSEGITYAVVMVLSLSAARVVEAIF